MTATLLFPSAGTLLASDEDAVDLRKQLSALATATYRPVGSVQFSSRNDEYAKIARDGKRLNRPNVVQHPGVVYGRSFDASKRYITWLKATNLQKIRDSDGHSGRVITVAPFRGTDQQRTAIRSAPRANFDRFLTGSNQRRPRLVDRKSFHGE